MKTWRGGKTAPKHEKPEHLGVFSRGRQAMFWAKAPHRQAALRAAGPRGKIKAI